MPVYLLVDNGSKKPEATLSLRELAAKLSKQTGKTFHAVSLQHADAINPSDINDIPAITFTPFLQQQLNKGEREFIILPLFFGDSRALTSFIPAQVAELEKEFGLFNIKVADAIYPLEEGEPRLAEIAYSHIQLTLSKENMTAKNVVLVDHGSPIPQITDVRKNVAIQLQSLLGTDITLGQAVMERREGHEYDFNGELLEDWLIAQAQAGVTEIIVAMLFFLPGRHAGKCGDIEEICHSVIAKFPKLKVAITPLISEHGMLLLILEDRLLAID